MGLESVGLQIFLFCLYFSIGAASIVLYSFYSWGIARAIKGRKTRKFVFFVTDLSFWIQYTLIVFAVIYHANNARIRLFYYIVMLAGLLCAYNVKLKLLRKRN